MSPQSSFWVSSTHPEDLEGGQVAAPGDLVKVDPDLPHTASLIENGRLVPAEPKSKRKTAASRRKKEES